MTIDISFLKSGEYEAEIFMNGVNADKKPEDYKKVNAGTKMNVQLAPGGVWTTRVYPVK